MQQGFRAGRELGKTGGTEFRTLVTGMRYMEWSTTAGTEVFGAQGNGRYGKQQGFRTAREKILNGEGSRVNVRPALVYSSVRGVLLGERKGEQWWQDFLQKTAGAGASFTSTEGGTLSSRVVQVAQAVILSRTPTPRPTRSPTPRFSQGQGRLQQPHHLAHYGLCDGVTQIRHPASAA